MSGPYRTQAEAEKEWMEPRPFWSRRRQVAACSTFVLWTPVLLGLVYDRVHAEGLRCDIMWSLVLTALVAVGWLFSMFLVPRIP